jgi:hypothetical protein
MASTGTALLDFGAFPGASDASIVITGQAGILSTSFVEAWIFPAATADHSADEHVFETLKVMAGNIVAGTGFTIYGINTNQLNEPLETAGSGNFNALAGSARGFVPPSIGGNGTRLYGKFNVGWVWT